MICRLMFTEDGRRFDARVDRSAEPPTWVVAVDHGAFRSTFPAAESDSDEAAFLCRLAQAALEKEGGERTGG